MSTDIPSGFEMNEMGVLAPSDASRGGTEEDATEEDAIDTFIDKYLPCADVMCDGKGTSVYGTVDDPYPAQCQYCYQVRMPARAAIQSLLAEARKDELEWLLDAQDQELDLDNRPIGEAYHVINDGTEHLINERLKQLAAQGKE